MELFAFLAACAVSAISISSLRRFVHAACHKKRDDGSTRVCDGPRGACERMCENQPN